MLIPWESSQQPKIFSAIQFSINNNSDKIGTYPIHVCPAVFKLPLHKEVKFFTLHLIILILLLSNTPNPVHDPSLFMKSFNKHFFIIPFITKVNCIPAKLPTVQFIFLLIILSHFILEQLVNKIPTGTV